MNIEQKKQVIIGLFYQLQQSYQSISPCLSQYRLRFSKTKTVLGSCHYQKKQISISLPILAANPIDIQIDTLKHEVAHALAFAQGERGHGKLWQAWAIKLGAMPKSRARQALNTEHKYRLVRLNGDQLTVLEKCYHRRVSLKNKYMRQDKTSLNQLFLVKQVELNLYLNGSLSLSKLSFFQ